VHRFGSRSIDFRAEVVVMAIVNRTPDSFHDRGRTFALDAAVAAAETAIEAGAAWVDVGGQPFAAGARLDAEEELERVLPVVAGIRRHSDVVISVDTFEPTVAARCLAAGADVINDTTGLRDPALADVIAKEGGHVVITHSLASSPRAPVPRPEYGDVVAEVTAFLGRQAQRALEHGIREDRIVLDPGHDLNKNTLHSLELTRRFAEIAALGYPTLAAVSNKDFIGETLDQAGPDRLAGSLAAAVICIMNGARIVRMHDAAAACAAVRMTEAVLGLRQPAVLRHNVDVPRAG
jgi:dihydropteroate synthase